MVASCLAFLHKTLWQLFFFLLKISFCKKWAHCAPSSRLSKIKGRFSDWFSLEYILQPDDDMHNDALFKSVNQGGRKKSSFLFMLYYCPFAFVSSGLRVAASFDHSPKKKAISAIVYQQNRLKCITPLTHDIPFPLILNQKKRTTKTRFFTTHRMTKQFQ